MKQPRKKTKIVATLGPASRDATVVGGLLRAGADVCRLNFSHGSHDDHLAAIETIRRAGQRLGCQPAILADLQGPKIRTGRTANDRPVQLRAAAEVMLTTQRTLCDERVIAVDYPRLAAETKPGQLIMINDGSVQLQVRRVDGAAGQLHCRVMIGGTYSSRKGVNLPNVTLGLPALTRKDRRDLKFIVQQDVQYVALSFVRHADDLVALRRLLRRQRPDLKIIAKIEKPEAAAGVDSILAVCDGIMVARGDLGVETSPSEVAILQKQLIDAANARGKLVIVATQMLESMIQHAMPTRAESTDVANAILDGADAVMLSGETAVGYNPPAAVAMMSRIAVAAERSDYARPPVLDLDLRERYAPHAVCEAATWASRELGDIPICVFTQSGATALYLAKLRGNASLLVFSPDPQVVKQLRLVWNVVAFELPFNDDLAGVQEQAEALARQAKCLRHKQLIVVISGTTHVRGATNHLRVKRVGED